ncbi:MAG: hypothetical protein R2712_15275 [Vicinamibacterales bacterium]
MFDARRGHRDGVERLITLTAGVFDVTGSTAIRVHAHGAVPATVSDTAARHLLSRGAARLLAGGSAAEAPSHEPGWTTGERA